MAAKYILGVLSVIFLCLGGMRLARDGGRLAPASKTWLLIGIIFAVVSLWLWRSA